MNRRRTEQERFWAFVDKDPEEGACWLWKGWRNQWGYGQFSLSSTRTDGPRKQKRMQAHRYAYELLVGLIPPRLDLDHLCRVRSCVNPTHLEPVTEKENTLRGIGLTALNSQKTHCAQDHPFSGDNLRISTQGKRVCKQCIYNAAVKYQAKIQGGAVKIGSCPQGHRYLAANLSLSPTGEKMCRKCGEVQNRIQKRHEQQQVTLQKEQQRFWAKVYKEPGKNACWLWEGGQSREGYGQISITRISTKEKMTWVHRYAYEQIIGPIPTGLHLDHLCRVRSCVNPAHLEPVTPRMNVTRSSNPAAANMKKTHCPYGHPYSGVNLYLYKGGRHCITCSRERTRIWKQQKKEQKYAA